MAKSKFEQFESILIELNISAIIGVVPACWDHNLIVEKEDRNFWDKVRYLAKHGWIVAQHGYKHVYNTNIAGILGINNFSEFAGLSYDKQFDKLKSGKEILLREEVWQPVFMPPAHSFDKITISALSNLGFKYISDGYGVYPYQMGPLTFLPSMFSFPFNIGVGVYTICLHVNNMSQLQIDETIAFIKKNQSKFISFDAAINLNKHPIISLIIRYILTFLLRIFRKISLKK